ncbi:uncharacterized protein LOC125207074 [Salvia hispanica]|uniref:uncharacterized protein LOC125207074 n=1 Tax=Salvia hispanica TaxID=49212 RepID=UPI002009AF77|nr:uncharacterized protein LOC125207074 [Salvia hispanica]
MLLTHLSQRKKEDINRGGTFTTLEEHKEIEEDMPLEVEEAEEAGSQTTASSVSFVKSLGTRLKGVGIGMSRPMVEDLYPDKISSHIFINKVPFILRNPTANVTRAQGPAQGPQSFQSSPSLYSHSVSECGFDVNSNASWYPDSGATHHISNDLSNLNSSTEYLGGPGNQGGHSQRYS